MISYSFYTSESEKDELIRTGVLAAFLQQHLAQFGDPIDQIQQAIDYVFRSGGLIGVQYRDRQMSAAVVVNSTGMAGYIPENILVYIAVHTQLRKKGLGGSLMDETLAKLSGDIAAHVDPENRARNWFETIGFTSPYLEMRLKRK